MDLDWVSFKRDSITSLDSLPFILIRVTGGLRLIPDAGHTLDCHRVNTDRQSSIHTHIQSMVELKPTAIAIVGKVMISELDYKSMRCLYQQALSLHLIKPYLHLK